MPRLPSKTRPARPARPRLEALEDRTVLSAGGNPGWAFSLPGASFDGSFTDLAADSAGNVYITGSYSGTVDFDPGASVANLTGGGGFVASYTSDGAYRWAKRLASAGGEDVAVDTLGNLFVVGSFTGTATFGE